MARQQRTIKHFARNPGLHQTLPVLQNMSTCQIHAPITLRAPYNTVLLVDWSANKAKSTQHSARVSRRHRLGPGSHMPDTCKASEKSEQSRFSVLLHWPENQYLGIMTMLPSKPHQPGASSCYVQP